MGPEHLHGPCLPAGTQRPTGIGYLYSAERMQPCMHMLALPCRSTCPLSTSSTSSGYCTARTAARPLPADHLLLTPHSSRRASCLNGGLLLLPSSPPHSYLPSDAPETAAAVATHEPSLSSSRQPGTAASTSRRSALRPRPSSCARPASSGWPSSKTRLCCLPPSPMPTRPR